MSRELAEELMSLARDSASKAERAVDEKIQREEYYYLGKSSAYRDAAWLVLERLEET